MTRSRFQALVQKYSNEYLWFYLKGFPEFSVNKLKNGIGRSPTLKKLEEDSLEKLNNNKDERTREEIIEWIKQHLDYESLEYIGW